MSREKIRKKKFQKMFTLIGLHPLSSPVRGRLHPPHPPGPGNFWIESHQPTDYRVPLVSASESGSQKSLSARNLK